MKLLEVNPNNEKYYTKNFISGYRCGIKRQFESDLTILDKIRSEIEEKYGGYDICEWFDNYDYEENDISEYRSVGYLSDILKIIDKYRAESDE